MILSRSFLIHPVTYLLLVLCLSGCGTTDPDSDSDDGGQGGDGGCEDPEEVLQYQMLVDIPSDYRRGVAADGLSDEAGDLVYCGEGFIDRAGSTECTQLGVNATTHCNGFFPSYPEVCQDHDDTEPSCSGPDCYEMRGCSSDSECADDEACVCAGGLPVDEDGHIVIQILSRCVPADCRSASDCKGYECGASVDACGIDIGLFACRSEEDECVSDAECDGDMCRFDEGLRRFACRERSACE